MHLTWNTCLDKWPGSAVLCLALVLSLSTPALSDNQESASGKNCPQSSSVESGQQAKAPLRDFDNRIINVADNIKDPGGDDLRRGIEFLSHGNAPMAVKWFRSAAVRSSAYGQLLFGLCLMEGAGIDRDPRKGLRFITMAAEQNNPLAQSTLAGIYLLGNGVEADVKKGFNYARRSAQQEFAQGMLFMGLCYENGIEVEANEAKALEWYEKAAKQGNAKGCRHYARFLENGMGGLKPDKAEALAWYRKAAARGDDKARAAVKRLQR